MHKIISCLVPGGTKVQEVLSRLQSADFQSNDISVLFAQNQNEKTPNSALTLESHTKAPEGAVTGGGTGGVIGGVLGWLAGIGTLAIPGLGPFIAAGPIMAMLSGTAVGAALGGLVGSLIGLGIPEIEAKQYETKLKEGYVLISVHTHDEEMRSRARAIFKESEAEDVTEADSLAA